MIRRTGGKDDNQTVKKSRSVLFEYLSFIFKNYLTFL